MLNSTQNINRIIKQSNPVRGFTTAEPNMAEATPDVEPVKKHYGDWPNSQGVCPLPSSADM